MNRATPGILLAAFGLGLLLALVAFVGCGATQQEVVQPSAEEAGATIYTVTRAELENPENKTVYVCPMVEHREQVSLEPEVRCSLCSMGLIPLEEAEKNWAEGGN